ncbi:Predicted dehydrogenase [Mariniphaga anaerophila]|uniref:Predicted dehydrogenase n=1 Tax=Mariniphaga anaerophila TaxID=1484053 RepID=A0A1M5BMI9_9BACT|nr:Gfo/Idh/MocA family oxidoreductase [Mariniphaga anaerophila]SHF43729.1 Predicted dehydrogenase [Mariniphaga anaerophila]
MADSKIKLAIIGMGRMGITHYSIINSHPDIQITAVADTSSLVLNLIKKYLKGTNTYSDYNKLFENESLDAIIVCTPPTLHYPIAQEAAQRGIHVFSEKPFTTDNQKAGELAELFSQKKLTNQVGYVNRFNDIFKTVKQYIEDDVIGNIIRFKSEMYSRTITKSEDGNTWRDSRENGGGAVYEVASHAIDLVNFLIGKPDKVTGSSLTNIFSKNVEDAVNATFLFENGTSGTLNVNWSDESFRKPTNKIEIFGSKGKILADQHGIKIFMKNACPEKNLRVGWNTLYITDVFQPVPFYVRGNEFTAQLYHFVECINDKKIENKCTFSNAKDTLDIIQAIFNDYELNGKF